RFNIGKTQAALIIRNKESIRLSWLAGENMNIKREFKSTEGNQIDSICYDWFCKARTQNLPIPGRIIRDKARDIAQSLGVKNFSASNGWLQRWRYRHNITNSQCVPDEADLLVPMDDTADNDESADNDNEPYIDCTDYAAVHLIEGNTDPNAGSLSEDTCDVNSNSAALMSVANLKKFLKDDFIALEHLKHLE
ncbi:hypothetical protein KR222_009555, partial [Zaprionus bogoriensis]